MDQLSSGNNKRNLSRKTRAVFTSTMFSPNQSVESFVSKIGIPGIEVSHPTIAKGKTLTTIQGAMLEYGRLNVELLMDEELKVWKDLFDVIKQYRNEDNVVEKLTDYVGVVTITDSKGGEILSLQYKGLKIESLGELEYDNSGEDELVTCAVSFSFDTFDYL